MIASRETKVAIIVMKELLSCMLISHATCPPSTIPPNFSSSLSRPDLVLVSSDSIVLFELTAVTNTAHHFSAASHRKKDCYGPLLQDLQDCFIC